MNPPVRTTQNHSARITYRMPRFPSQSHSSLARIPPTFITITRLARRDEIFPGSGAASMLGEHVIDRRIRFTTTAVLTRIVIADKYLAAGQLNHWTGPFYVIHHSNHRSSRMGAPTGPHAVRETIKNFRFAFVHQHKGTPVCTHVQWLIVLIENQYLHAYSGPKSNILPILHDPTNSKHN